VVGHIILVMFKATDAPIVERAMFLRRAGGGHQDMETEEKRQYAGGVSGEVE